MHNKRQDIIPQLERLIPYHLYDYLEIWYEHTLFINLLSFNLFMVK